MSVAAGFVLFRRMQSEIEYLLLKASYGSKHWSPPKGNSGRIKRLSKFTKTNLLQATWTQEKMNSPLLYERPGRRLGKVSK